MGKETSLNKAAVVGIEDFQMQIARCNQIIEERLYQLKKWDVNGASWQLRDWPTMARKKF